MARGSKVTDLNREPKLTKVDESTMRLFQELIEHVHDHLSDANMQILFRNDPKWSKKFEISCPKGVMLFLTGYNFTIILNRYALEALTVKAKYALIDLILCYCSVKNDEKGSRNWYKAKPDYEGFFGNYERFGEWTQAYQQLQKISNQLKLFENGCALELAEEAKEMRNLKEYYDLIDRRYQNSEAFPRMLTASGQ